MICEKVSSRVFSGKPSAYGLRFDVELPVFIFAQARRADTGQEEMERWELDFRGRPRVCYSCFKTGHLRQGCPQGVTYAVPRGECKVPMPGLSKGRRHRSSLMQQADVGRWRRC